VALAWLEANRASSLRQERRPYTIPVGRLQERTFKVTISLTLDELNAASATDFTAALGAIFENAPWVAERAAAVRPFATVAALHEAMLAAVRTAPPERVTSFLRGHPELAGAAAQAGAMGDESKAEQAALGLHHPADDTAVLAALNAAYWGRFGFPFILCVRRHTRSSLAVELRRRLQADPGAELETALNEVGFITRLRIADRVAGPDMPAVNGSLTTHILDTSIGCPAAGIALELLELGDGGATALPQAISDRDGRTERPLLSGAPLRIGVYELRFHVGAYFAGRLPQQPPFLNTIPIRFGISEPEAHYHIPLLVSPGAYSTYRGS